jgi:transcriptional antiterminator NusG
MNDKEKLPTEEVPEVEAEAIEAEVPEAETPEAEPTDEGVAADVEVPQAKAPQAKAPESENAASQETEATVTEDPEEVVTEDSEDPKVEEAVAAEPSDGTSAEGDGEEVLVDTGPPKRWYVVHTYSGHENKVKVNIQKMINTSQIQDHFGQIIVPTEEVTEMKKGKKTVSTRKFFPSYILVEMYMSDEARHLVSDIPGVTSFVGTASGPQPLSKTEVERILGRMDKEKQTIIPEIPFALGEHIRIKDGPFSDFTGVIDEINAERGKLKVLVSIFGRETPVELDFLQVESL